MDCNSLKAVTDLEGFKYQKLKDFQNCDCMLYLSSSLIFSYLYIALAAYTSWYRERFGIKDV